MKGRNIILTIAFAVFMPLLTFFGCGESNAIEAKLYVGEDEYNISENGLSLSFNYGETINWNDFCVLIKYSNSDRRTLTLTSKNFSVSGDIFNMETPDAGNYNVEFTGKSISFNLNIEIKKAELEVEELDDPSKVFDNKPVNNPNLNFKNNSIEHQPIYEYKKKGEDDSHYSPVPPIDAGRYVLRIIIPESKNFKKFCYYKEFIVEKQTPEAGEINVSFSYSPFKKLGDYILPKAYSWENVNIVPSFSDVCFYAYKDLGENYEKVKVKVNINFLKASLESLDIINNLNITFNQSSITPTWKASFGGKDVSKLVENNVIIKYLVDNRWTSSVPFNAGTYKMRAELSGVTFLENFIGTETNFTILKAQQKLTTTQNLNKVYNGKPAEINLDIITCFESPGFEISYYSKEEKLANAPKNAGTYTVKILAQETLNYNSQTLSFDFTISKAEQEILFLKDLNKTYDGAKVLVDKSDVVCYETPEIVLDFYNNNKLVETPKDAGAYLLKITAKECENYNAAIKTVAFKILKAKQEIEFENKTTKVYDGTKVEVNLANATCFENATLSVYYYKDNIVMEAPVDAGEYSFVITAAETKNYQSGTFVGTIIIEKASQEITYLGSTSKDYDGKSFDASSFSVLGNVECEVLFYKDDVLLENAPTNAGKYKAKITAKQNQNYKEDVLVLDVEIVKICACYDENFVFLEKEYEIPYGCDLEYLTNNVLPKNANKWSYKENRILNYDVSKDCYVLSDLFYRSLNSENYFDHTQEVKIKVMPAQVDLVAKEITSPILCTYNKSSTFIDLNNIILSYLSPENFVAQTSSLIGFNLNSENFLTTSLPEITYLGSIYKTAEIKDGFITINCTLTSKNFVIKNDVFLNIPVTIEKANPILTAAEFKLESCKSLADAVCTKIGKAEILMFDGIKFCLEEISGLWQFKNSSKVLTESSKEAITFIPDDKYINTCEVLCDVIVFKTYDANNITTEKELVMAIKNGETQISITNEITLSDNYTFSKKLTLNVNAKLTISGELSLGGNIVLNLTANIIINANININGNVVVNKTTSKITNSSKLTICESGSLNLNCALTNKDTLQVDGTLITNKTLTNNEGGTISAYGTLENNDEITNKSEIHIYGTMKNNGTINCGECGLVYLYTENWFVDDVQVNPNDFYDEFGDCYLNEASFGIESDCGCALIYVTE